MKINLRETIIKLSKIIFYDEILRKKCIVILYNFKTLFYKKNKSCDLFDYSENIKNKRFFCHELYMGNFLYGTANNLRMYSDYKKPIKACIEHGIYFGDFINKDEVLKSGYSTVITFGDSRKDVILRHKNDKNVICIGPYIQYAKSILDDKEIKNIRRKNGKTLLVFPSHSIGGIDIKYNINSFIRKINDFKKKYGFKTVLVCLYYKDIEKGVDREYINEGFRVISAGRREDQDFLRRLKSFILMSDYAISNSIGTHIGYTVLLNVPHTILRQDIKYISTKVESEKHIENIYDDLAVTQKQEIFEAFREYVPKITETQRRICDKYWGFRYVMNKEKLKEVLTNISKK